MVDLKELAKKVSTMKMQCTVEERLAIIKALNFTVEQMEMTKEWYRDAVKEDRDYD